MQVGISKKEVLGTRRRRRWFGLHLLPLLWTWALLVAYPFPPATDWPVHTAVAGVLAALWRHDPCVSAYYAVHLQATPYHLLYAVLTPAVAALGTRWGGTAVLMALSGLTHGALWRWARILGRPTWMAAYSPFIFFGVNFAWGFGPTMMGVPCLLWGLAEMTALWGQPSWRRAGLAGLWGALAVASHAVFLPCCALWALPFVFRRAPNSWRTALAAGALASVPAWPMLILGLMHGGGHLPEMRFEPAFDAWNHLRLYFARFDRGLCRGAHEGFVALALVALLLRRRRCTGQERYVLAMAAALALALVAVPISIETRPTGAWLLNVRYLSLADACLVVVAMPRRGLRAGLAKASLGAAVVVFLLGMGRIYSDLNRVGAPVQALGQRLPAGTVWGLTGHPPHFGRAWPPLSRHLLRHLSPTPVCFAQDIFAGGHLPIRVVAPPAALDALPFWP